MPWLMLHDVAMGQMLCWSVTCSNLYFQAWYDSSNDQSETIEIPSVTFHCNSMRIQLLSFLRFSLNSLLFLSFLPSLEISNEINISSSTISLLFHSLSELLCVAVQRSWRPWTATAVGSGGRAPRHACGNAVALGRNRRGRRGTSLRTCRDGTAHGATREPMEPKEPTWQRIELTDIELAKENHFWKLNFTT